MPPDPAVPAPAGGDGFTLALPTAGAVEPTPDGGTGDNVVLA